MSLKKLCIHLKLSSEFDIITNDTRFDLIILIVVSFCFLRALAYTYCTKFDSELTNCYCIIICIFAWKKEIVLTTLQSNNFYFFSWFLNHLVAIIFHHMQTILWIQPKCALSLNQERVTRQKSHYQTLSSARFWSEIKHRLNIINAKFKLHVVTY